MIFQDSGVETGKRVGVLKTSVNYTVDHGFPSEWGTILRDIVSRTHVDVFPPAIKGDQHAPVEHIIVWLNPGARTVTVKLPPERNRLPPTAAVLPRPPLGGDNDRRQVGLGRILEAANIT